MSEAWNSKKKKFHKKSIYPRLQDEPRVVNLIHKQYTDQIKTIIKNTSKYEKSKKVFYCYNTSFSNIVKIVPKVFRALVSLYAVVIYILGTYYDDSEKNSNMNSFIKNSEFTIAFLILIDITVSLIISKKKMKYLMNYLVILDLSVIFGILLAFISEETKNLSFIRIFRFLRVVRVLRFFKIFGNPREGYDISEETNFNILYNLFNILAVIFISSGIIHFIINNFPNVVTISNIYGDIYGCLKGSDYKLSELNIFREGYNETTFCPEGETYGLIPGNFTFDIAFYYTVITLTSTGYGEIYPTGSFGRAIFSVLIFIFIVCFTIKINQLNDIIKFADTFKQSFMGENHIVITGNISKTFLMKFLTELNINSILSEKKALIISQEYPSKEIQYILNQYSEVISYYFGELLNEKTVLDCNIEKSSHVFLICDPYLIDSKTLENETNFKKDKDQLVILACKFFSKYCLDSSIICQFHYSNSLLHNWAGWDIGFSSEQIQMAMISKNGYIDGFITLVSNLITKSCNFYCEEFLEVPWISEYVNGATNKIHILNMSESFFHSESMECYLTKEESNTGERFIEYTSLVKKFLLNYNIILIGVKTQIKSKILNSGIYDKIYLNPFGYNLKKSDKLIVIASNIEVLENIMINSYNQVPLMSTSLPNSSISNEMFKLEKIRNFSKENDEKKRTLVSKKRYFKTWDNDFHEVQDCLNNHILLYSSEEKIEEFMRVFQVLYDEWVFYVSDTHPTSIWEDIKDFFPKLVFIESSFSDIEDYKKLNVVKSRHIFIFSWKVKFSSADSGILPIVKMLEENFPKTKCTIELEDEENLKYLNNFLINSEQTPKASTFLSLYKISSAYKQSRDFEKVPIRVWPKYAKSEIFFSSFIPFLPAIFYHSPDLLEILLIILGLNDHNYVPDSPYEKETFENNYEIGVYVYNYQKTSKYEDICRYYLNRDPVVLPIAVYRTSKNKLLKNPESYIVTNPKNDMVIQAGDKILCFHKVNNDNYSMSVSKSSIEEFPKNLENSETVNMLFGFEGGGFETEDENDYEDDLKLMKKIEKEFEDLKKLNSEDKNLKEILLKNNFEVINQPKEENLERIIEEEVSKINEFIEDNGLKEILNGNEALTNLTPNENGNNVFLVESPERSKNRSIGKNKKLTFAEIPENSDKKTPSKRPLQKKLGKTLKINNNLSTKKRLSVLFDFNLNNAYKEQEIQNDEKKYLNDSFEEEEKKN